MIRNTDKKYHNEFTESLQGILRMDRTAERRDSHILQETAWDYR